MLWRHDIDLSPHRALALARIEAGLGICATYLVRVRSPFYNVFERPITAILREIGDLGHEIGLHAEPVSADRGDVYACLYVDRRVLEAAVERKVRVFSFHNPTVADLLQYDEAAIEDVVNAFSRRFSHEYTYVSDSGGSWRQPIRELLDPVEHPRLHVATHPEWWTRGRRCCRTTASSGASAVARRLLERFTRVRLTRDSER